jgi:PAS domain S-box-containing protein
MILFVGVVNGLLVFTMTGKTITNRIKTLTDSINGYANNHSIRVASKISGHDEISKAALAFDNMANDIEISQVEIKESRDQFKALITNIPGITFRCALDADWTMLFISGLVEELTGYPASDFVENSVRTYTSIIYPHDVEYVDNEIQTCVKEDIPYTIEYRIVHRSGEIRWVHERGRGVRGKNGDISLLDGFILDITERHKIEVDLKSSEQKLAISNADLVQFTNIAAHHLQEPTRRIVSFVQRLKEVLTNTPDFNDDLRIPLQFIEQSAIRQRALVSDIQLYLAATQPHAKIEAVDVANIIRRVEDNNKCLIQETKACIKYGNLPTLWIDRPRLYDIFNVLIENALHYRKLDCIPKIYIHGELTDDGVHYYVEDNGIGIPDEYRERVFLVFERLQVSENQESTGIGLAIVRRILESCHGTVNLLETVGGGTTVVLNFPKATH